MRNAYLDALGIDRWVSRATPQADDFEPVDAPSRIAVPPVSSAVAPPVATRVRVSRSPVIQPPPAGDWGTLRENVAACVACDLCKTRTQTVFGVGNTQAEWLVIG